MRRERSLSKRFIHALVKDQIPRHISHSEHDILQFSSPISYAFEAEGDVVVDVMRIGELKSTATVNYKTEDSHAKAGEHYEYTEGQLTFDPGENLKSFRVPLVRHKLWSPCVEFKVHLSKPTGSCRLGNTHRTCRIKFVTKHIFPTDRYQNEIQNDNLEKVWGMFLIWEYLRFNMRLEGMRWRMVILVVLSQAHNLYWYLSMKLSIYLVDVLCKAEDDDAPGLWLSTRHRTAILLGIFYVVPFAALHFVDWLEIKMQTKNRAEKILQLAIFRTFLDYSQDTMETMDASDLNMMILSDVPELVHGAFLVLLPILRFFGKISVVCYYIYVQDSRLCWFLVIWPALLISFVCCRYRTLLEIGDEKDDLKKKVQRVVLDSLRHVSLLATYSQRPRVNHIFEKLLGDLHEGKVRELSEEITNHYYSPWLGTLFLGFFVAIGSKDVFNGTLSVGAFVTTIHVFKDVGDECKEIYKRVYQMCMSTGPLGDIIIHLNRPNEVPKLAAQMASAKELVRRYARLPYSNHSAVGSVFDTIDINLSEVQLKNEAISSCTSFDRLKFELVVKPGTLVAVVDRSKDGEEDALVRVATAVISSLHASSACPSHLRTIFVSQQPVVLHNLSCYENLTFGLPSLLTEEDETKADERWGLVDRISARISTLRDHRIRDILEVEKKSYGELIQGLAPHMGADDSMDSSSRLCPPYSDRPLLSSRKQLSDIDQSDYLGLLEASGETTRWSNALSHADLGLLNLSRAFLMNPELICAQRPAALFEKAEERIAVLQMLRDYVDTRGLERGQDTKHLRRPRTCCFTTSHWVGVEIADHVWEAKSGRVTELSRDEVKARILSEVNAPKVGILVS